MPASDDSDAPCSLLEIDTPAASGHESSIQRQASVEAQAAVVAAAEEKVPLRQIVFLSLISALPPVSTDMYLGAMPTIASQWQASTTLVNLSLILWFVAFSVGLLVFGPLSDKFGRKPILLGGLTIFMVGCLGCALSGNVTELILFRIIQGMGAAGPSAMTMAIARDRYQGQQRKHVLAYMGIIMALAPMVAPMLGAMVLTFSVWQNIFVLQGLIALAMLLAVAMFQETIVQRIKSSLPKLLGRYRVVMANRRYMLANAVMGLLVGPLFGFIAMSSHIYTEMFHLSEQAFGLYFGFNALMLMTGAFLCTRLTRIFSDVTVLTTCMIGSIAGGAGIILIGSRHPMLFALAMGTISMFCGMSRPLSNHLILDQVETDVGSASSFSVFYISIVGAVSMTLVSLPWPHEMVAFGVFAILVPAAVLLIWPLLIKQLVIDRHTQTQQGESLAYESHG